MHKWLIGVYLLSCSLLSQALVITPQQSAGNLGFGMHFHKLGCSNAKGIPDDGRWPTQLEVPMIRLWDSSTDWRRLEPVKGQFNFSCMDHYINLAQKNKSKVVFTLGGTPAWASTRPLEKCAYDYGCAAEPTRISDWEDYVRTVATRYKGKIQYYEIWNEPMFQEIERDKGKIGFYSGSVKKMVEMASSAYRVIKTVDPEAQVLSPAFTNGADRLDLFLQEGGKFYIDGLAYHFYAGSSYSFLELNSAVQAVIRKHNIGHLPLLNTEWGVGQDPTSNEEGGAHNQPTDLDAAALISQLMILNQFADYKYSIYYSYDSSLYGLVDTTAAITLPQLRYFETLRSFFKNNNLKYKQCDVQLNSMAVCEIGIGSTTGFLVWSSRPMQFTLPSSIRRPATMHVLKENGFLPTGRLAPGMKVVTSKFPMLIKYD